MQSIDYYLRQITPPAATSHKGQNGKLLIIGGSELFHAASRWSLDVASKCVDMVFYSSVPSNNELIREAKQHFWNGIVVERDQIESYIEEADCILIGPGMTRTSDTEQLTNHLLQKYASKKWVIDAGALQMIDPTLLTTTCIITPHFQELQRLASHVEPPFTITAEEIITPQLLAPILKQQVMIVLKGIVDQVFIDEEQLAITGGNAGMTKGGTGDVLAGLIAALYCTHDRKTAAVVGSLVNKKAGEFLYQTVGPYFNASDLVQAVPQALWAEVQKAR